MQSFVRMPKLTDIVGRADYIRNEKKSKSEHSNLLFFFR